MKRKFAAIFLLLTIGLAFVACTSTPQSLPATHSSELKADNEINLDSVSFKMEIQDIFTIKDVGIALTGVVETGTVNEGSEVTIVDSNGNVQYHSIVNWLESIDLPEIKSASIGDKVGLMFEDTNILYHVDRGLFVVIE